MPGHDTNYLFVYGSLRSGFRSQAYEYISRFFVLIGEAKVKGYLVDLGGYPAGVMSIEEKYIKGELYHIKDVTEFDWAIGQLDDYEGTSVEPGQPQLYRREITDVLISDQAIPAWIYWYNGDVSDKPVIESGDMVEYLQKRK
jgi:gamma-glutamylcyclotransferase (GGCT)/AIG2-like uncharacterized protein YtfP